MLIFVILCSQYIKFEKKKITSSLYLFTFIFLIFLTEWVNWKSVIVKPAFTHFKVYIFGKWGRQEALNHKHICLQNWKQMKKIGVVKKDCI